MLLDVLHRQDASTWFEVHVGASRCYDILMLLSDLQPLDATLGDCGWVYVIL